MDSAHHGESSIAPGRPAFGGSGEREHPSEAQRIVEEAERDVIALLERERPRLDALAHALLEHETLDQPDAYRVADVAPARPERAAELTPAPA